MVEFGLKWVVEKMNIIRNEQINKMSGRMEIDVNGDVDG